jgi:N-sulfoglucosamine sulfohydrolase
MQGRVFLGDHAIHPAALPSPHATALTRPCSASAACMTSAFTTSAPFTTGPTFASLNRYKEKCFPIQPLMRQLHTEGKLTGPPLALMQHTGPCEELFDTQADPHEIHDLSKSDQPEHREALVRLRAALDTWIIETGDRGAIPEPLRSSSPLKRRCTIGSARLRGRRNLEANTAR